MNAPKVVVAARVFPETLARLADAGCTVVANPEETPWSPAELAARCAAADALVAFMTERVDAALLKACPRLRIIAGALKGPDNLDIAACTEAGVWVSVVPDLLTEPTAELAVGLALALSRHIVTGDARVRGGTFQGWRPVLYGAGIGGSRVGVAGMGRLGQAVARMIAGFRPARLMGFDPAGVPEGVERLDWPALLSASELLILALPLTPGTVGLLDATALARLPPGARVVNVGRGSVVDEAAVAAVLRDGRLGGFAADVFAFEDLSRPNRPSGPDPQLLASPNTLFTPHLGSATIAARRAIEAAAVTNVLAVLRGEVPPDAVNRPPRLRPGAP